MSTTPIVQPFLPDEVFKVNQDREYLTTRATTWGPMWLGAWSVQRIREHRDMHQEGRIFAGHRLSRAMLRDANVVAALRQRVAPAQTREPILSGGTDRARRELGTLRRVLFPMSTLVRMWVDMAMCGLSILQNVWEPSQDGARWDVRVEPTNLDAVLYSRYDQRYYVYTRERGRIPVNHGDGKWTIVRPISIQSHEHGAVIPLAMPFMTRGQAVVDRAGASKAIGNPKLWGTLPPSVAVQSDVGKELNSTLSTLIQGLAYGVGPDGVKVDPKEFTGQGWQIFESAIKSDRSDIFLALTGQDGGASNSGGSYTKALVLENVLFALVEADTKAASDALTQGVLRPWSLVNLGSEEEAPCIEWPLPDPEEDARLKALAERHKELTDTVTQYRTAGFEITQEFVDALAEKLRIGAPVLAPKANALPELFAYHQRGKLFTRDEIRESRGRAPIGGALGAELVDEAIVEAEATSAPEPASPQNVRPPARIRAVQRHREEPIEPAPASRPPLAM